MATPKMATAGPLDKGQPNERAEKLIAEANERAKRSDMRADIAMELARKAAA